MKKIILFLSLLSFTTVNYISCSNDDDNDYPVEATITPESLPVNAKNFVSTYFTGTTIKSANKSTSPNIYNSIYSVLLSNGFEIDFDKDGNWTEIDSENNSPIPEGFLSNEVSDIYKYVTTNYSSNWITSIDKENYGFSVELNDDLELIFNKAQEFIGIDNDSDSDDEIEQVIAYTSLPKSTQDFVKLHFPTAQYVQAKKEIEANKTTYKVYLSNGYKIKFDASGNWIEIESKNNQAIPVVIIPENIYSYIINNYSGYQITSIDKQYSVYELEIRKGYDEKELKFDMNGNFLSVDN